MKKEVVHTLDDLVFYYAGREQCFPGKEWTSVRDHWLFHLVCSGRGTVTIHGRRHEVHAGQGFLFHPQELSSYRADMTEPWSYRWVGFHGRRAPEIIARLGLETGGHLWTPDDAALLRPPMEEALASLAETRGDLMRISLLYRIFHLMESGSRRMVPVWRPDESEDPFLSRVQMYVARNFAREGASVEEMAAGLGMSRNQLCRRMQQASGTTPGQLLRDYRMESAKELLANTMLPVQQVAASVGYQDPLTFSRAFRNHVGTSPRDYRIQREKGRRPS